MLVLRRNPISRSVCMYIHIHEHVSTRNLIRRLMLMYAFMNIYVCIYVYACTDNLPYT